MDTSHEPTTILSRRRIAGHYALLILITAFAAVLRFSFIDRPYIWGDEGLTFDRVFGTFDRLLHRLAEAGFAPLHYELLWLIGQHHALTPFFLRLVPAISGILMVPAMYWLTRELLSRQANRRGVALLVALLTASNAFLLNYSRDAKMYSPFWMLAAVNVAALLWWLRTRRGPAYFAWIASGAAMLGFDTLGCITLVIELLVVLTFARPYWLSVPKLLASLIGGLIVWLMTIGPVIAAAMLYEGEVAPSFRIWLFVVLIVGILNWIRISLALMLRWERRNITERLAIRPIGRWLNHRFNYPPLLLFIIGLIPIAAGPVGYYLEFNRFFEKVETSWRDSGLNWIGPYNLHRTGPTLVGYTYTAYLTAWEWPREEDLHLLPIRTFRLEAAAVIALSAMLVLGLLPWGSWRGSWRDSSRRSSRRLPFPHDAALNPPHLDNFRTAFWMVAWIVLPAYGMYCVSVRDYVAPTSWLGGCIELLRSRWWINLIVLLIVIGWVWQSAGRWRHRAIGLAWAAAIAFAVFGLATLIYKGYPKLDAKLSENSPGWQQHDSLWMPRYLAVILPPLLILMAILLLRLPTRPLRWGAIALFVIANLSQQAARVFAGSEPPTPLIAQDFLDSQAGQATVRLHGRDQTLHTRSYFTRDVQENGHGGGPGGASMRGAQIHYYLTILSNGSMTSRDYRVQPPSYRFPMFPAFELFIENDVRRSPALQRFVTWETINPSEDGKTVDLSDPVLDVLSPQWRLESQEDFADRDHWRWLDITTYRRRVYVRNEP